MIRIKICCIKNAAEAEMATTAGADALGFVSAMPSGPGIISENDIREIIASCKPFVTTVLLTSKNQPDQIERQARFCRAGAIQLCEPVTEQTLNILHSLLPEVKLISVIHVAGRESIDEAYRLAPLVDAFLLDTGQRSGQQKQLGGTGRTHDWSISAQIVNDINKPVILAGGLNPENVQEAISIVHPYAVDVCSGVRTGDILDKHKLINFMRAVQGTPQVRLTKHPL